MLILPKALLVLKAPLASSPNVGSLGTGGGGGAAIGPNGFLDPVVCAISGAIVWPMDADLRSIPPIGVDAGRVIPFAPIPVDTGCAVGVAGFDGKGFEGKGFDGKGFCEGAKDIPVV